MSYPETARSAARAFAIMKYSGWDWVPIGLGFLHLAYILGIFVAFPYTPWPFRIAAGFLYAISISWSINSVSHNFIHNPFFVSKTLNTLFSYLLSITIGFSQAMYNFIHMRHHSGNMDRPGKDGNTIDYISIYKHGRDGRPENIWKYTFLSFFRTDPNEILARMGEKRKDEARLARRELIAFTGFFVLLGILNWEFIVFLLPFWYLGHSLSSLNGYYEHFGGNPDKPIAWGVSTYDRLYNWTWLNNGYHAEHHYRPKQHWTKMRALHEQIKESQEAEGVRVIRPPHPLGFLDPDLPHAESRG
jgi:fatty acid desaturase